MPQPVENISSDIIDLLKDRYTIADSVDEKGNFTDDPTEIKIFSFNFVNKKGENKGSVVVSLLDDAESSNSLKMYFGQDIADSDPETKKEWYVFLQEMRRFAKMHLLGFDVRNINKSKITRRDVEHGLQLTTEDIAPMFESSFGPIDGTVKTSRQPLGDVHIVIKHSDRVDPEARGGRSRRIQKIYLVNNKGEKFLLPFPSLLFARAMARHIEAGGTPYDNVGGSMCQLMDEMKVISNFIKFVKNRLPKDDPRQHEAIESSRERYREIKKQLARLTSASGYNKFHSSVPVDSEIVDDELHEDIFNGIELDEESQNALPYIYRAYDKFKKIPEQNEFEKWVNATHGQGEGQEILTDEDTNKDDEEYCPNSPDHRHDYESDWNADYDKCTYCDHEIYVGYDLDKDTADWSDFMRENKEQIAKGKKEAEKDKTEIDKEREFLHYQNRPADEVQLTTTSESINEDAIDRFTDVSRGPSSDGELEYANSDPNEHDFDLEEPNIVPEGFCPKCKGLIGVECTKPNQCITESIPDREDNELRNQWTPCEEYGHRYDLGDEEFSQCINCGEPKSPHYDPLDESRLNEFFGLFDKKSKTQHNIRTIQLLMKKIDFEPVVQNEKENIWTKGYFTVIFGPAKNGKLGWVIARNGKLVSKGFGDKSFFVELLMNNPEFHDVLRSIHKENNQKPISEADIPSSAGFAGPLTFPHVFLGSNVHSKKQIAKHENTTGKLSPLSLISSPEKDVDEAGGEIPEIAPQRLRNYPMPSQSTPGLDNISRW